MEEGPKEGEKSKVGDGFKESDWRREEEGGRPEGEDRLERKGGENEEGRRSQINWGGLRPFILWNLSWKRQEDDRK